MTSMIFVLIKFNLSKIEIAFGSCINTMDVNQLLYNIVRNEVLKISKLDPELFMQTIGNIIDEYHIEHTTVTTCIFNNAAIFKQLIVKLFTPDSGDFTEFNTIYQGERYPNCIGAIYTMANIYKSYIRSTTDMKHADLNEDTSECEFASEIADNSGTKHGTKRKFVELTSSDVEKIKDMNSNGKTRNEIKARFDIGHRRLLAILGRKIKRGKKIERVQIATGVTADIAIN